MGRCGGGPFFICRSKKHLIDSVGRFRMSSLLIEGGQPDSSLTQVEINVEI
jgi:hypothetical protein